MEQETIYGLTKGMTLEEVKSNTISLTPQPDYSGEWFSFYPQIPEPQYKYYSCQITKKEGLTKICAWTQNIQTKNNGAELYSLFEHLRDHEQQKYGEHRYYHVLKDDAIYKNPDQLTLSILKNERVIMCIFAEEFQSKMPSQCKVMQLQAYARDEYSGNVMKRYFF